MSSGKAHPTSRAATLALVGCELAFDFTNTTSGRGGARRMEHLQTAEDVVVWARHATIIAEKSARDLRRKLAQRPQLRRELLRRTLELRDIAYGIGVALAADRSPQSTDVDRLTQIHAGCLRFSHLTRSKGVYVWIWESTERPVEAILGPITLSALSSLSQADLSRVKQCPGEDCGWLFFDTTKNKNRRWCEMEVCGNRAKQKRLRKRKR
jgi:predicted RNA-binding Zn ribbon-like protein